MSLVDLILETLCQYLTKSMEICISMLKESYKKSIKTQFSYFQKKTFPEAFHTCQNQLTRIGKSFLTSLLVNVYLDRLCTPFQVVSFTFSFTSTNSRISRFFQETNSYNLKLQAMTRQNRHKTFDLPRLTRSNKDRLENSLWFEISLRARLHETRSELKPV